MANGPNIFQMLLVIINKNVHYYSDTIAKMLQGHFIVTQNVLMLVKAHMVQEGLEFTMEGDRDVETCTAEGRMFHARGLATECSGVQSRTSGCMEQ